MVVAAIPLGMAAAYCPDVAWILPALERAHLLRNSLRGRRVHL